MRPIRVLHIVEAAEGGVARHLHDLCIGLTEAGHACHIVYADTREDDIFRLLRADLRPRGVGFDVIQMHRGIGPRDLSSALSLRRLLVANGGGFDILHAHSSKAGALLRLGAPSEHRARIVYTPHAFFSMNPTLSAPARKGFGLVERALSYLGGAIITVSPQERDHAIAIGIPRGRVHMIPHGIAPYSEEERARGAALRSSMELPADSVVFCFVGRFVPQKAPEVVLKAFLQVAARDRRVRLILAGDGPQEATLRQLAVKSGVPDRVFFPGRIDGRIAFLASDAAIQLSRYESFGYVFLEALAAGVPLIATPTGIATELDVSKLGCVLIPPDDVERAIKAIEEVTATISAEPRPPRSKGSASGLSLEEMTFATVRVYAGLLR